MPKVLISDKLSPEAVTILESRGIDVDFKPGLSVEDQLSIIGDYDGLAIRSATKVTKEMLAAAKKLKVVGRAGIGVDNVDIPAATSSGVVVMNTPFGNAVTTAEHAIAMMFAAARMIPQANASTHAGKWEKSSFMGQELTGKTLGLVGSGNIGRNVVERAIGLKMKVVAYDPFLSEEKIQAMGAEKVTLDELLVRADVITLHVPATKDTRNMIAEQQLKMMKKTAILINCARGGLVDEAALKDALDAGEIAAAALDVYEVEPAKDNILFGHPKVICTPHLGASTGEAQEKVALQVAEQIADYLVDGAITNALNAPSLSAEQSRVLSPYLLLARQVGAMAGQLCERDTSGDGACDIKSVKFGFEGDAHPLNWAPLKQTILQALLSPMLANVNMVNAGVIAQERGIAVSDGGSADKGVYNAIVSVDITTANKTRSIKGTLFGTQPRIVEIKGIQIESSISQHMLYVTNTDKPGFIGALGNLLSESNINIGTFHLGRDKAGGDAIALVEVDDSVPESVLAKIRQLPLVTNAVQLNFDV